MELLGSALAGAIVVIGMFAGIRFEDAYMRPRNIAVTKFDCVKFLSFPALLVIILGVCFMITGNDAMAYLSVVISGLLIGVAIALS